ncbi:MAG: DUF1080 domain-containing protein [Puniceicoccaceae bacterium]
MPQSLTPHAVTLIISGILLNCSNLPADDIGWISLFNGEDLSGWSVQCLPEDRGKTYWSVQEGTIQCDSMNDPDHDYVWLQFDREFEDFELKLKFRSLENSRGNSGVQFRSRYDDGTDAPGGGWLDGPQADINPRGPFRNGLIYDETRSEKRWINPSLPDSRISPEAVPGEFVYHEGDWNDMFIRCLGTRIVVVVNGIQITNFNAKGILDDKAHQELNVGMNGYIALQLHRNDALKIQFKDLFLREL